MYLYLLLGLMCCIAFWQLACLDHDPQKRPTIWWYYLFVCLIFMLGALRWERGGDWRAYTSHFDRPDSVEGFEIGYQYTIEAIKWVWNDFSVYLFLGMFVILWLIGRTITRYSPLPLFSLAVFFAANFAGLFFTRQLIAVAICLYCLKYIEQRRLWPFLIGVGLAVLYHRTAFLFLIAYPVYRCRFSTWVIVVIIGVSMGLSLVLGQIIISAVGILGPVFQAKIAVYLQAGEEGYAHGLGTLSPMIVLLKGMASRGIVMILLLWILKTRRKTDPVVNGFVNIYLLGVCLFAFMAPVSSVLARATIPFDAIAMFLLPVVVTECRSTFGKLVTYWLIIGYLFVRLNSNIEYYRDLYIPYKSIFNKELPVDVG